MLCVYRHHANRALNFVAYLRHAFRIPTVVFHFLEQRLAPHLKPSDSSFRKDTLSLRERIAIPLTNLGSLSEDSTVASGLHGCGRSTVSKLMDRFTSAVFSGSVIVSRLVFDNSFSTQNCILKLSNCRIWKSAI